MPGTPRVILRLEVTSAAKQRLDQVTQRLGMTHVAVTSRLIEWLADQSESVQGAVLGRYPHELQEDIAKLILQRMAGGDSD
jgi:hypothetical protein